MTEKNKEDREPQTTTCLRCGAARVLPILYGYPGVEARQEAVEGKVVLRGCMIAEGAPTWRCGECGHEGGYLRIGD